MGPWYTRGGCYGETVGCGCLVTVWFDVRLGFPSSSASSLQKQINYIKNPRSVRITHAGSWGYVKKGVFGGGGCPLYE